jgi:hypothetical protein
MSFLSKIYHPDLNEANHTIQAVIDPSAEFKEGGHPWRIAFFNADGSAIGVGGGEIGPMGPQGPAGPDGPQGIRGVKGDTGDQGIQGNAGAIGPKGDPGDQGIQGVKGDQGIQGVKGDTGDQGIQGVQGNVGPQGIQGNVGAVGPKGDQGNAGPAGAQGVKGDTGAVGATFIGAWSNAIAYTARDVVNYNGSSYVALANRPAGSANPKTDAANWLELAHGGGEIARAEYVAGAALGPAAGNTQFNVPGMNIVVPAGSGPFLLEAVISCQVVFSAAAVAADSAVFRAIIMDEANIMVTQGVFKSVASPSISIIQTLNPKRVIPGPLAADKTYRLVLLIDAFTHITQTAFFGDPGVGATSASVGPATLQATAR